jgi:hypothetical protein
MYFLKSPIKENLDFLMVIMLLISPICEID